MLVLILDAQQRSALAAIRSLGQRGISVICADSTPSTLTGSSRFARSQLLYPDPYTQPSAFTTWVADTAKQLGANIVLPMTDVTTMLLAPLQSQLQPAIVACGAHDAYEQLSHKGRLLELASAAGIRFPATRTLSTLDEAQDYFKHCAFPIVLKPARSKVLVEGRIISTTVSIAPTLHAALDCLRQARWFNHIPCLAQEFVAGEGAGVFALYAHGKPAAWFAHRRIREKPPSGGVSVLSESTQVNAHLRDCSERLLSAARWHGPAMVEYKMGHDGVAYLMEVNCRFWGSLQLAIDSGVDFPWEWIQILNGTTTPKTTAGYHVGRRLRWLLGDLDNLLIQLRGNGSTAGKAKACSKFLATFFDLSCKQEIFRWSDPKPAFVELRQWLRALA